MLNTFQTQLHSLSANLPSYFGTDQYELEITVISSSIDIDTVNQQGGAANVQLELIIDLPAGTSINFPQGQTVTTLNYMYDASKFELIFELPFHNDNSLQRSSHKIGLNFVLQNSYGIHFLSFTDSFTAPIKKKKAVSADPNLFPFVPNLLNQALAANVGEQIKTVSAVATSNVFNEWDIYAESNHYHAQHPNGTKVFLNLILDIPADGVLEGLDSCTWDGARKCIDLVFNRSIVGGAATSSLSSIAIQAVADGAPHADVYYYSFKYSDEIKRKKVILANPDHRP